MNKTVKTIGVTKQRSKPALTPEGRENQLIALAVDLAEKQLLEGTASSQVIVHYLKMGSTKEKLEQELMAKQKELMEAKTDKVKSEKMEAEIYQKALDAMKIYSGNRDGK